MKTKILVNIFVNVSVLFLSARLLAAGSSDRILNFNDALLGSPPPAIITFDAPGAAQGPARAQSRLPSTRQGRSRDATPTRAVQFTLSWVLRTAPSSRPTLRAREQAVGKGPGPSASTLQARAPATTPTRALCFTVSCALPMVSSLPSTSRVQAQVPARVLSPGTSTQQR